MLFLNLIKRNLKRFLSHNLLLKIKFLKLHIISKFNRLMGNSYISNPRETIHIESTSYCNLNCVFCAYGKKSTPKINVSIEHFKKRALQAISAGYKGIDLTPITGDVFMDKNFIEKLDFLETCDDLEYFSFYTNAVLFNEDKIKKIFNYKKLKYIRLSIYGHNLDSFLKITRGNNNEYNRLIDNLKKLLTYEKSFFNNRLFVNFKSNYDFDINSYESKPKYKNSELAEITKKLAKKLGLFLNEPYTLNNWGGLITNDPKELNGAEIKITNIEVKKDGACNLIFSDLQIMSDGTVNACACRDVNATLKIGNINNQKLKDIVSPNKNKTYKELIDNQQMGKFNPICTSCDYYKSIYVKKNYSSVSKFKEFIKIGDFFKNF
jgi:MoaA/NifB/PqqE/SkfB family radical SAM enzyme